jgi:hypothetical protein
MDPAPPAPAVPDSTQKEQPPNLSPTNESPQASPLTPGRVWLARLISRAGQIHVEVRDPPPAAVLAPPLFHEVPRGWWTRMIGHAEVYKKLVEARAMITRGVGDTPDAVLDQSQEAAVRGCDVEQKRESSLDGKAQSLLTSIQMSLGLLVVGASVLVTNRAEFERAIGVRGVLIASGRRRRGNEGFALTPERIDGKQSPSQSVS